MHLLGAVVNGRIGGGDVVRYVEERVVACDRERHMW